MTHRAQKIVNKHVEEQYSVRTNWSLLFGCCGLTLVFIIYFNLAQNTISASAL